MWSCGAGCVYCTSHWASRALCCGCAQIDTVLFASAICLCSTEVILLFSLGGGDRLERLSAALVVVRRSPPILGIVVGLWVAFSAWIAMLMCAAARDGGISSGVALFSALCDDSGAGTVSRAIAGE